jgi:hypothetical protein
LGCGGGIVIEIDGCQMNIVGNLFRDCGKCGHIEAKNIDEMWSKMKHNFWKNSRKSEGLNCLKASAEIEEDVCSTFESLDHV